MSTIHLACASDERYVEHSAAMIHSALANRGSSDLHVHYLVAPHFPEEPARLLKEMVGALGGAFLVHRIPDDWVAGMPVWSYIGSSMWYRLFLPELIPDAPRALYLDVDTIVADELAPLWEVNLSGACLGAVTNVFERHRAGRPAELGLTDANAYFNSGVLLLNLDAMRADECTTRLAAFARDRASELLWPDQDTLSVVLGDRRVPLHPRWNCMNAVLDFPWSVDTFGAQAVEDARTNPGIRHFEGPAQNKPWHYLCERADRDLYFSNRRGTPWPDVRLEARSPANVAKKAWRRLRAIRP